MTDNQGFRRYQVTMTFLVPGDPTDRSHTQQARDVKYIQELLEEARRALEDQITHQKSKFLPGDPVILQSALNQTTISRVIATQKMVG